MTNYAKEFEDQVELERKERFKQLVSDIINEAYQGKAIYSDERTDILLNTPGFSLSRKNR